MLRKKSGAHLLHQGRSQSWYFLRWIIDFPLYFLRKRSTEWEQVGLSLIRPSGEAKASVFRPLSFRLGLLVMMGFSFSYPNVVVVLLLFSYCSLMEGSSDCFLACFNFFSHSWRSRASALFQDFSFQSQARSYLLDRSSYRTVAYQLLEARFSYYSLSMDLKFYICIKANYSYFLSFSFSNRSQRI